MKVFRNGLVHLMLLAVLVSCGKDNESGKKSSSSSWDYYNGKCANGAYCQPYMGPIGSVSSPYQVANIAQTENPCPAGTYYANNRIPVQVPMPGLKGTLAVNDIYVGVTSYGDVAVLVGKGAANPPILYAYMCPRAMNSGAGQITPPELGSYSQGCNVKGITAMNMFFPDGQVAKFRDPAYGVRNPYTGQKIRNFSFCPSSPTM